MNRLVSVPAGHGVHVFPLNTGVSDSNAGFTERNEQLVDQAAVIRRRISDSAARAARLLVDHNAEREHTAVLVEELNSYHRAVVYTLDEAEDG